MTTKRFLPLVLVPLLLNSACGKKDEDKKASSPTCDMASVLCSCDALETANKSCDDYEGMTVESAQKSCTTAAGTFSSTALCTATGRVGTCKVGTLGSYTYSRYYSDAVTAKTACTLVSISTVGAGEWTDN